jgi:DNA-directed RNA polymerase specialized sigma24 family protein
MGRKRKEIDINHHEATFRDLDRIYRENERNDPMVAALNALPADERSLMILYIANGCNKTEVGRILGASEAFVRYKIKAIQEKVKNTIDKYQE